MYSNKTLLGLLFLLLSHIAVSQQLITLEAGVLNSTVRTNNIPNSGSSDINNYFIGAGFGYRFNSKFEFKGDLSYQTKGYDMRFGENQFDIIIFNFDYLNLSPQISFRPTRVISFNSGLSYSYKLRERSREAGLAAGPWVNSASIKNVDFAYNFGVKFHFNFFYFKLLFEKGVMNINNLMFTDENGNTIEGSSLKNKSIQLGFGFYLWG